MPRRAFDFYPTPESATRILLDRVPELLDHVYILEPCAGNGAISKVCAETNKTITVDIDPAQKAMFTKDARTLEPFMLGCWLDGYLSLDMSVITNPPFDQAFEIVKNFVEYQLACAFLLRLSFLEPTEKRGAWLAKKPPDRTIVLPRISFTGTDC